MAHLSPPPGIGRSAHRIVDVERTEDGIVVAFNDGRAVVFDVGWLYEQIPSARLVVEPDDPDYLSLHL